MSATTLRESIAESWGLEERGMLSVSDVSGGPCLTYDVCSKGGLKLYSIIIVGLDYQERKLNDGRFKQFDLRLRDNKVTLGFDSRESSREFGAPRDYTVEDQIEWLARETHGTDKTWGLNVESEHTNHLEHHFFFSDPNMAVLFKLYWS